MRAITTIAFLTILAAGQASFAKHAYFSQQCTFTLDGAQHATDQHYFGDVFSIDGVRSEYISANSSAVTAQEEIAVTLLSENDGAKDVSSDGDFTTEIWIHDEVVVIRKVSAQALKDLGYKLEVGDRLELHCRNQIDEP